jgi:hypothetical protein
VVERGFPREKALLLIPRQRFEKLGVFVGARRIAIHYRNQTGRIP